MTFMTFWTAPLGIIKMSHKKRYQLITGCLLLVWLAACTSQNQKSPSTIEPTSTLVALSGENIPSVPTPETAALRDMILESFEKQESLSWRYNSTTVLSNGEKHTTLVEFQPPRRYHIVSDGKSELTIIDEQVYAYQNGQWILVSIPIDSIIDSEASQRLEKSIKDILYIGSEYLDEKAMLVSRYYAMQKTGDTESPIEVTLWIGNDDHMPYKMLVKGQTLAIDGQTGEVKGIDSNSTVFYEYDPTIEIATPK